jgi:hypothetical protein
LETVAAIHRFVTARIERNLCDAATLTAGRGEHFAWTAAADALAPRSRIGRAHGFASLAAIRAAIGFVLKTFLLVKALLARTED